MQSVTSITRLDDKDIASLKPGSLVRPKLWVSPSDPPSPEWRAQKKTSAPQSFYKEMRPVLFILRFIARFSYEINEKGEMVIEFRSKWMLYTIVVYLLESSLAFENTLLILSSIKASEGKIEDLLHASNSLMFMAFHFYVPVIFWREWWSIARYFNMWRRFEEEYADLDCNRRPGLSRWVLAFTLLLFPTVFALVYLESAVLYSTRWFHRITYVIVFMYCNLYLLLWVFSCIKLIRVSSEIREEVEKLLGLRGTAWQLGRCRRLWLALSDIANELGNSLACSLVLISIVNAISFVACCYVLLTSMVSPKFSITPFVFILVVTAFYMYVLFEMAHRTTQKVGSEFIVEMMRRNCNILDQKSAYEVDLFLQAITMNPPIIKLGGFVTVNRTMCVSLLSSTVTYLIVLVQFKSSEK